jgi:hypothetical protein
VRVEISRCGSEYNRGIPPWREKIARPGLCGRCRATGVPTTTRVKIAVGDAVEELGEFFIRMDYTLAEKKREQVKAGNTMVSMFNGIMA